MARSPGQRGTFGAWLTSERERRYPTQGAALAAYRKLRGLVIAPSEYAQWESGSRVPKTENPKRLALLEFYGSAPEEPLPVPGPPDTAALLSALIAAIDRQTEALLGRLDTLELGVAATAQMAGQVRGLLETLHGPEESRTDTPPKGSRRKGRPAPAPSPEGK